MAKDEFKTGISAVADLTKNVQSSLQKLPPVARILGYAAFPVGAGFILLMCFGNAGPEKFQTVAKTIAWLMGYSVAVILIYSVCLLVHDWMRSWERIQLMRMQNAAMK